MCVRCRLVEKNLVTQIRLGRNRDHIWKLLLSASNSIELLFVLPTVVVTVLVTAAVGMVLVIKSALILVEDVIEISASPKRKSSFLFIKI